MMSEPLTPSQLFLAIVLGGLVILLLVYIPVQVASKLRRMRRAARCLTCRICGYRFVRSDRQAICPNCRARNRA